MAAPIDGESHLVVGLLFWPRVIVAEAGLGTELLLFVANLGFNAIKLPFRDCTWTKNRRISGTTIGTIYYILSLGLLP